MELHVNRTEYISRIAQFLSCCPMSNIQLCLRRPTFSPVHDGRY